MVSVSEGASNPEQCHLLLLSYREREVGGVNVKTDSRSKGNLRSFSVGGTQVLLLLKQLKL